MYRAWLRSIDQPDWKGFMLLNLVDAWQLCMVGWLVGYPTL